MATGNDFIRRPTHPAVYLVLYLPFGVGTGFISVALGWLASNAGAGTAAVAALVGWGLAATTWKVLWSPLIDTTLDARTWYVAGTALTALGLVILSAVPISVSILPLLGALTLGVTVAATLTTTAIDRYLAFDVPDAVKGRAGGWSQAGNLGGTGLGGGLGLWLAQHSGHPWIAGVVLAAVCLLCVTPLFGLSVPERIGKHEPYLRTLKDTGLDILGLVKTRIGLLACFLMLLPIGTGGLANLWGPIAAKWGADGDEVALVGGVLSGLVSIPGCILGGLIADRIDRKLAYLLFGLALSGVAVLMALLPRTPLTFLLLSGLYNAVTGFCYGAYAAVALEAIGQGAAGTKFNLISSISAAPILLVTLVDGWAAEKFGVVGMLYLEAGLGIGGCALYALIASVSRGVRWTAPDRRIWAR